jgi:hypothetical protein
MSLNDICRQHMKAHMAMCGGREVKRGSGSGKDEKQAIVSEQKDMSDGVDQKSIVLPPDGLITLQKAIDSTVDSSDFSINCFVCNRKTTVVWEELPQQLWLDFAQVQPFFGSTAQALIQSSLVECKLQAATYRLVGMVYWRPDPKHFTAQFLAKPTPTAKEQFFFYDDTLNQGQASLVGDAFSIKDPADQVDIRGNVILLVYERA